MGQQKLTCTTKTMNKSILLALFSLTCILTAPRAQRPILSPLPQKVEWGGKAFRGDQIQYIRTTKGVVTDKGLAKYKRLVPKQAEGYYLKVTPGEIVAVGRDEAGLFYAEQTLRQITSPKEVMQCEIADWPSVECRGVIEGFYGNPWSHRDRLRQFEFYGQNKLNTYVYGPKDDPYHRTHWREPYPDDEAARIRELAEAAHRNHVQFVWALHPGMDIRWNLEDSIAVVSKLEKMYSLGVRSFAIFFDDIWGEGAKGDKQAGLLNYVTDQFVRKHRDVRPLILCPTQYNKSWSSRDYLSTLGNTLYPEIRIMWTGNSVVDMIGKQDMEWINSQIKRKAFIWLNYPVNDYCQSRLLMGKTYGNDLDIYDMVSGFCSNPMEYAEASKVSLYSIADYTWNMPQYDSEESWQHAMATLMPTCKEAFGFFCMNNVDLGKTGHGLRREGESPQFGKSGQSPLFDFILLDAIADALLADSVNQPEMLQEIAPWVESMKLLGQRGIQVMQMNAALERNDTVEFIGHYKAQAAIEQKQKAITSRDYEGSIVKAKPVVSGDVITPWVNETCASLVKEYKSSYTYGKQFLPYQVLDDGQYLIMAGGKYLTDAEASTDRTGDFPVFLSDRDTINPQRQLWNIELSVATGRYKVTNVQDGRYVNERGAFWADKDVNPYDPEWHTFTILRAEEGYTIQCGGRAGNGYWILGDNRITNGTEPYTFHITPLQ